MRRAGHGRAAGGDVRGENKHPVAHQAAGRCATGVFLADAKASRHPFAARRGWRDGCKIWRQDGYQYQTNRIQCLKTRKVTGGDQHFSDAAPTWRCPCRLPLRGICVWLVSGDRLRPGQPGRSAFRPGFYCFAQALVQIRVGVLEVLDDFKIFALDLGQIHLLDMHQTANSVRTGLGMLRPDHSGSRPIG